MTTGRVDIVELKYRYCYATDHSDVEALLDVYTEDAYFEIGIYGSGTGHDDVREYIEWFDENRPGVRAHQVFNPIIEIQGDQAQGRWYYVVMYEYPDKSFELAQGSYQDEYRRVDGDWKISSLIASRRFTRTF